MKMNEIIRWGGARIPGAPGSVNEYSLITEIITLGQVTMITIQKKKIVMTSVQQI